jgi:hypothetical protein
MTKTLTIDTDLEPLSYYLDFQPGEHEFLDSLVEEHGSHLQNLTQREKLFMLAFLANSLSFEANGEIGDRIIQLSQDCFSRLGVNDLLALITAVSDQLRGGYYAESNIKTEQ